VTLAVVGRVLSSGIAWLQWRTRDALWSETSAGRPPMSC